VTDYDQWFSDIWDAIVTEVRKVSGLDNTNVFYTLKKSTDVDLGVYVCTGEASSTPATFKESHWSCSFEIGIMTVNTDTKAGMLAAWQWAWKIIKELIDDRTLGGLTHTLECSRIIPYWRGLGIGIEQHWVGVIVDIKRKQ